MVTIYCIEDINDLKYVGSTKHTLKGRLIQHITSKRMKRKCSSIKLDLDNCKIYSLETCNECDRYDRERYWINKIECVNINKLNYNHDEYKKKYYEMTKNNDIEKLKDYWNERSLFRTKRVTNGCYEFIKMLEEY